MENQTKLNTLLCTSSKLAYENAKSSWENDVNIVHYNGKVKFDNDVMRKLVNFKPDIIIGDIRLEEKLLHKKTQNYKIFSLLRQMSDNSFLKNIPVLLFSELTNIKEVRQEAQKYNSIVRMVSNLPSVSEIKKYSRRIKK